MSHQWENLSTEHTAILKAHGGDNGVLVRASTVRALRGNGNAAILLNQFIYWSARSGDPDGWFYNTQEELEEQTGLSAEAQHNARRLLKGLGLLEEVRCGVPARLYYRLNLAAVVDLILEHTTVGGARNKIPVKPESGIRSDRKQDPGFVTKQDSGQAGYIKDSTKTPPKTPQRDVDVANETPPPPQRNPTTTTTEKKEKKERGEAFNLIKSKLRDRHKPEPDELLMELLAEDPARDAWFELSPTRVRSLIAEATARFRKGEVKFKSELIVLLDRATKETRQTIKEPVIKPSDAALEEYLRRKAAGEVFASN